LERPTGSEPLCHVVLLGPMSTSSREQLVRGLQERFNLTARQAEALVQKAPVIVKKGLTIEKANSLASLLEEIGARVRIERVFPEPQRTVSPRKRVTLQETVPPKIGEISPESYCLWEDMENLGFFKAFFGTIAEVLFHPTRFFSRMPVDKGLIRPLIFALVMGVLGGMFSLIYQFLMMASFGDFFEAEGLAGFQLPIIIGSAIGLPIITVIGVFVVTAVLHVCLMIVRGNRRGFEATFRVIAYAMSTQILGIIPFLGGLIGAIWGLVIEIIGIRESHTISTGRAALAIFLPVLVVLAFLLVLAAVLIPIIFRIFSEFMGNY